MLLSLIIIVYIGTQLPHSNLTVLQKTDRKVHQIYDQMHHQLFYDCQCKDKQYLINNFFSLLQFKN